ncbi:MAG: Flp pilus assembly complex ATPase component TadA [Deltaproteobacteria bacterium]|nr:Flp pilus assembly complex ATPase component TadA [Deltaproteobacteria bacterium]
MTRTGIRSRKKLGEILVQRGQLTPEQLAESLREQMQTAERLGQILIKKKILTEEELTTILGEQLGIPHIWLRKGLVDPHIVHILPKEKALRYQVIPMFRVNNVLTLATSDPNAIFVFDEISKTTNMDIQPVLCRTNDILEAINAAYGDEVSIDDVMSSIDETDIEIIQSGQEREISEIAEMAEGSPVINLTNMVILRAIRDGASDIHIEPQPDKFRVRIRIDGILYELMAPKMEMHPAVVSRLKVMANLDIAERRIPQDGRFQVNVDNRTVDLRFSSMPGIVGEKVVLRILDKSKSILDLNTIGLDPENLDWFKNLLRKAYGLILVCGPTGSGKTTTLYAAITMLNSTEKNIVTIEDPVEYQLKGINQNQVLDTIGLSFAKFLKHALRQDPDILMVGEIRDRETAETAIQASLTGHLVLSTLHTNDSPSAVTRLLEMGVEPYLISSSLLACIAQRLVRTICPECKTSYSASKSVLQELNLDETRPMRFSTGRGCSECYDSGFKGRIGIYEILEMDDGLQNLILTSPTIDVLQKYFRSRDHKTLRHAGNQKVIEGVTTIEEVRRAASLEA